MKYSTPNISCRIVSREHGGIDRVLRAMRGRRPDLVVDEVGDVDTRVHPGVDAVP